MLNDFSWDMAGYISKYPVSPSDDGIPYADAECIFQLDPESPKVSGLNDYILSALMDYDPGKGAEYATYIYPFIRDAMLRFRMQEEQWSVSSLTNYKMLRFMAYLYHNTKDAVGEFAKKYSCDLSLAEEY